MTDYFLGFKASERHPHMPAVGTEGRCVLCGHGSDAELHLLWTKDQQSVERRPVKILLAEVVVLGIILAAILIALGS